MSVLGGEKSYVGAGRSLQNALLVAGGAPVEHRGTDSLSAAFKTWAIAQGTI